MRYVPVHRCMNLHWSSGWPEHCKRNISPKHTSFYSFHGPFITPNWNGRVTTFHVVQGSELVSLQRSKKKQFYRKHDSHWIGCEEFADLEWFPSLRWCDEIRGKKNANVMESLTLEYCPYEVTHSQLKCLSRMTERCVWRCIK